MNEDGMKKWMPERFSPLWHPLDVFFFRAWRVTKKSIVNEIIEKLKSRNITKSGCTYLEIPLANGDRIAWVGYTQVMISHKVDGALRRNKRYPLYSKAMTMDLLEAINSSLEL